MNVTDIRGGCVIVGASRGFGAALAQALRERHIPVIVVSRTVEPAADARRADVTDPAGLAALARSLDPRPRHLVYTAASQAGAGRAADPDLADARAAMDVAYFGFLATVQAFLPVMLAVAPASITLVGSRAADMPPDLLAPYGAAKAAAETYARGLAQELAGSGVRVNVLRISAETDLVREHRRVKAALRGFERPHQPLPHPAENTEAAMFLLSTAAEHLNGKMLAGHWRAST